MTLKLIRAALVEKRVSLLAYGLGGLASIWLYLLIYPSLSTQLQSYNQIIKSMSPAVLKAFGISGNGLSSFEGYIGTEQYGFVWPLLLLFLLISFAGTMLAGEIESGTIGLWLAAPISRAEIYWSKFCAGIITLLWFLAASVLAVIPLAGIYHIAVHTGRIVALTVVGGLFGLAVLGLAALFSAIFSAKGKVYATMGVLLIVMYILNILANLTDQLAGLRFGSFFHYYNPSGLLNGGPIDRVGLLVFGITAIVAAVVGAIVFNRRNITI